MEKRQKLYLREMVRIWIAFLHQTMKICVIKRRWAAFCAIGSETVGIYNLCKAFDDFGTFFNADDPAIQRNMIVGGIAPLHIRVETVISSAALILLL